LELKCTLIDYEKITNDAGQRLVFFGHYAGLAGMIDTLWAAGRRLSYEGVKNPFEGIRPAHGYHNLEEAKGEISKAGEEIRSKGLDGSIVPFVVGIAGYGHVSKGVQEILACLPVKEITPEELIKLAPYNKVIYKVVFKEEHTVMPAAKGARFELQDYFRHPERYRGCFERYVPYLTLLVNCIYWDKRYPRLVTKRYLEKLYKGSTPSLRVIGDISCDVDGSIEATVRCTDSGDPVFVYDVEKKEAVPGYKGRGPVVLAVDNLPCELPRESSAYFSGALKGFIPAVAEADYNVSFDELALPPEIKRAVIVHKGELTPDYNYLAKGGNL
jgi:alpha-aminoadipic semialdehyde synthase